jgi:hypothetical protein
MLERKESSGDSTYWVTGDESSNSRLWHPGAKSCPFPNTYRFKLAQPANFLPESRRWMMMVMMMMIQCSNSLLEGGWICWRMSVGFVLSSFVFRLASFVLPLFLFPLSSFPYWSSATTVPEYCDWRWVRECLRERSVVVTVQFLIE